MAVVIKRNISELNNEINKNYQLTQLYYQERKKQFEQIIFTRTNSNIKAFEKIINDRSKNFNKYVIQNVWKVLDGKEADYSGADKGQAAIFSIAVKNITDNKDNNQTIWSKIGIEYEHYLANNSADRKWFKDVENYTQGQIENCLQYVGNIAQKAWNTRNISQTRTDLGYKTKGKITEKTKMELTSELEIENINENLSNREIVNEFIDQIVRQDIDTSIYGFQLKTYKGVSGNKWTGSSEIAKELNKTFGITTSIHKTWNTNYSLIYASYFLSTRLINILNPVNVAFINRTGLMWISDLISKYRFYIETTSEHPETPNLSTDERGGKQYQEIFPMVKNNNIYFHGMLGENAILQAKTSTRKDKELNKEIVVATLTHTENLTS